jgi:hypothetical protein
MAAKPLVLILPHAYAPTPIWIIRLIVGLCKHTMNHKV